jgi:hypothetical protein
MNWDSRKKGEYHEKKTALHDAELGSDYSTEQLYSWGYSES